ncbi:MAG TPA: AAA family ATPase [Candidatus Angelobacter sp.]|nr:AAA family ATPase [Candidatus Angelobacter sp.]
MNIKFRNLILQFRKSREVIELSHHVSFFHGRISSGKTSIAKLIDACLGGSLPQTPAMKQELVSVQLAAQIGEFEVLFERAFGSNQVQVSWIDKEQKGASILAPIDNSETPIWGDKIYGLSDLIFQLAGVGPMRVRRNKTDPDAPLIPLSFRDVMWYCYLDQDELDSTFYHLGTDDPRLPKSRDVMRFVLGYYTERLNDLEQALAREVDNHRTKLEAAAQLRKFFEEMGYESELDIQASIQKTEAELTAASKRLIELRSSHNANTHFADDLRSELRQLGDRLANEDQILADLEVRIGEEQALRAEVITTKFKLSRLETASTVLENVHFETCPQCGASVGERTKDPQTCSLCGSEAAGSERPQDFSSTSSQRDLDARLIDIEASLKEREKARRRQQRLVQDLRFEKMQKDMELTRELTNYDSAFLSQSRNLERTVATLEQKLTTLNRDARIPATLARYEREADHHLSEAARLRREINLEKSKLSDRESRIEQLENYFFEALRTVGFPGLTDRDKVKISRRTWMVHILPDGNEELAYNFFGAGSGGKKTLFNVCYAIAVHRTAEVFNLPLPTFLIIDSPMKNIGKDVNKDIFMALYAYIYKLAKGPLSETNLIIIDSELASPTLDLDFYERLMLPDDKDNPPLIPYYRGH